MNVLFLGDVYGKAGRDLLKRNLKHLRKEFKIDLCIANLENLEDGRGVSQKSSKVAFSYGIDYATSGNHIWDRLDSHQYINSEKRLCVPANYPKPKIGRRCITALCKGKKIVIINLAGQHFMKPADSPFEYMNEFLLSDVCKDAIVLVDFHAETTAEKRAMGWFLDGKVTAVVGTHTHIQTADEEILPEGTAYITDIGMTGGHDSVIGAQKNLVLQSITEGIYKPYYVSKKGMQINGVVVSINDDTLKSENIIRVRRCFNGENS